MHKLFKHTTLMNIFFAVLMSIPLISIGVRCAYVTINKNAYQSYSDTNIVKKSSVISDTGNLLIGELYTLNLDLNEGVQNAQSASYKYQQISLDWLDYGASSQYSYDEFRMYRTTSNNYYVYLYENNAQVYTFWNGLGTFGTNFEFSFVPSIEINQNGNQCFTISTFTYFKSSLDNVFEYSINQFISSNDFGNLNFFTWFNGVFFTNNAQASTYINFINWYMNYMLLVSCGYILLMMLMWFVNLARKILDRSLNIYDK